MHNIKKACVLGAGTMGCGIAAYLAGVGVEVYLLDILPKELNDEEKNKGLTIQDKAVRNRFAQKGKNSIIDKKNRICYDVSDGDIITAGNFTDDLEKIKECDWVIEVVVENLEIKKSLVKDVYKYWHEGMVVSTNTSGIEISKIVEDMPLEFKKHFLGTHFFNPVRHMKLLEIIPIKDTLPQITDFMCEFGDKILGKGIVLAKDTPCFVTNRMGVYSKMILFKAMEKYNFNLKEVDVINGPVMGRPKTSIFGTLDIVGLDVFMSVLNNLKDQMKNNKEEYDKIKVPEYIQNLYDNKFLGNKSGQGFFKKIKDEKGERVLVFDSKKLSYEEIGDKPLVGVQKALEEKSLEDQIRVLAYGTSEDSKFAWEVLKGTMIYAAERVPEIADDYKTIDKGLMWGQNWTHGPFKMWDILGVRKSVEMMQAEGETIPAWVLGRLAEGKENFYEEECKCGCKKENNVIFETDAAVLTNIGDGVTSFTFKTKGNAFSGDVISSLSEAIDIVNEKYTGMIIANLGKNFSVGADLNLILESSKAKDWKAMEDRMVARQYTLMKMKYSKKPIVVALFGRALGGGAELVMHGQAIVAHMESKMGLVETGVGLVPAGGGIKEMLVRSMAGMNKNVYSYIIENVKAAWNDICFCYTTSSAKEAENKNFLTKDTTIVANKDYLIDIAKAKVIELSDKYGYKTVKKDIFVTGTTGMGVIINQINSLKDGKFISEYDAKVAKMVGWVITGGDVPYGTLVTEEYILSLERQAYLNLCKEEKTMERIDYMLKNKKQLKN